MKLLFAPVPFYCEENIWRLCLAPGFIPAAAEPAEKGDTAFAVFAANKNRTTALLKQKASSRPDGLVLWDYHAFAVTAGRGEALVWDFDTRLPFPCPAGLYLAATFPAGAAAEFRPGFRLLPGTDYAALLVSDRSHMRDAAGNYLKPPPPWPAPGEDSGRPNNLMRLIDPEDGFAGELPGIEELKARFGRDCQERLR